MDLQNTTEINPLKAEQIVKGQSLVAAAGSGKLKELVRLLKKGTPVDADEYNKSLFYESKNYVTPLQKACEKNRLLCARMLIASGADVNARDRFDVTALHMAAQNGHYQCLKLLLDAGAECSVPTKHSKKGCYTATPHLGGTTPLHLAAANNHVRCVRELILSGADYNAIDEKGRTSLYIAAEAKQEQCVLVHLRNAVGRDILSLPGFETGDTPLHFAVRNGMCECIRELLNLGSDPNHLNHAGMSPLHDAVSVHLIQEIINTDHTRTEDIVRLLVLNGYKTDVNLRDGAGYTPLHYVSFTGVRMIRRPKIACFLLEYGANPKIQNPRGFNIIENEIKSNDDDSSILKSVLKTYLHPPNLNMMKLLLPNSPPVFSVRTHPDEIAIMDHPDPETVEYRLYRGSLRAKCLWYVSISHKPRTLQHICRYHIRKGLGYRNLRRIKDLPLPIKLQDYLFFKGPDEFDES